MACPECGRRLRVPTARPGRADEQRSSPRPSGLDANPRTLGRSEDLPRRPGRSRIVRRVQSRTSPWLWVGIGLGGFAVIALGVVVLIWTIEENARARLVAKINQPPLGAPRQGPPQFGPQGDGFQGFQGPFFGDPPPDFALNENFLADLAETDEDVESAVLPPIEASSDAPAKEPLPAEINQASVRKVKRATVHLSVETADGKRGEGSGFFAMEPGVVVTNAHVIGMLGPRSPRPKHIDVVLNSGEPDEKKLSGEVLALDRSSDLALLRVGNDPSLPPPLPVRSADQLTEVQKVYIFGFPFGTNLGKQIAVSGSSISSLRKDPRSGIMNRIQVNGGMHPGNSGGPVADTRGDVIGVSVSAILGTQINFAIPGDFVKLAINGRVLSYKLGYPDQQGDQLRSSYALTLLDPLKRIRATKVEFWHGQAGATLPSSRAQPASKPGDGPHQVVDLPYKDGKAAGLLVLPRLAPGQVLYTRPMVVDAAGQTTWLAASPNRYQAPLERKPALLVCKHETATRKLLLHNSVRVNLLSHRLHSRLEIHIEEQLQPKAEQTSVRLRYDRVRVGMFKNGQADRDMTNLALAARALKTAESFLNRDVSGNPDRPQIVFARDANPVLDQSIRSLHDQIADALELVSIAAPNRLMNPGDTWKIQRPISLARFSLEALLHGDRAMLELTLAYEGIRRHGGREQAVIGISGMALPQPGQNQRSHGRAAGQAIFDLAAGQFTLVKMTAQRERDWNVPGNFAMQASGTITSQLTRNLAKIPVNPREVFRSEDKLTAVDPADAIRSCHHKVFKVPMKAGKTYLIEMAAVKDMAGQGRRFDPFLRLEDSRGDPLDEDDDSGGDLNARILFLASADDDYRIIATTFAADETGNFILTVKEE